MPRKKRFYQPGVPAHVFQRGHNKDPVFFDDRDYLAYLRFLKAAADELECLIHAYVLMTNHVHLLATPKAENDISLLFQNIGRHFVPYINKTYQRRGSLWEGRHKGNVLDSEPYFLTCMRYIEMNPVRAAMVEHPGQYRWSSYAANAQGIDNVILQPHALYLALGGSPEARQAAYRAGFDIEVQPDELELIRACLHSGTPLGNDQFKKTIESVIGCRVGYRRRGRPAVQRFESDMA